MVISQFPGQGDGNQVKYVDEMFSQQLYGVTVKEAEGIDEGASHISQARRQ